MNDRRTFLKTACKPLVLAAMGISVIEACSKEDNENNPIIKDPSSETTNELIVLDMGNSSFSELKNIGGWINYSNENVLLVRIDENEVRAFDNKCPHQGNRDKWSYNGSDFTCGYHNNSYSNSCGGQLTCFTTKLEGDILTITN